MDKQIIDVPEIYPMTWQYSPAIKITGGSLVFISGIVGYSPDEEIARGDIGAQAEQAFKNLEAVLRAAGG
ncbi:MAG: RidA family protein, partial [Candidatus Limnocylindrales bacterium]